MADLSLSLEEFLFKLSGHFFYFFGILLSFFRILLSFFRILLNFCGHFLKFYGHLLDELLDVHFDLFEGDFEFYLLISNGLLEDQVRQGIYSFNLDLFIFEEVFEV